MNVVSSNGRGGSYTTTYQYSDARIYPGPITTRRNLGFGSVTVIDGQTGQYTRTSFNQWPGKEGTIAQTEDRTAAGQLLKLRTLDYDVVFPVGTTGVELVRERQETLDTYELGTFSFSQFTTTSYDDYGNPIEKAQFADGLPTVTITTSYVNDLTRWILGRVTRMTTASGSTTLGDMMNTWTGDTITSKSEWLDTNNSWRSTTMSFDPNGNVTSVTEPATGDGLTRTTLTEFDPTYRAYVTRVTNALGHVTGSTYDGAGLVTSSTDANGNSVVRTYDVFGRPRTESGPGTRYSEWEYRNYGDPNRQCNRVTKWVDSTRILWKDEYFDGTGFNYGTTGSGDCASAWLVVDRQRDGAGRPNRTSQPYCYGGTPVYTTTTYDAAGRVGSITTPDGKVTRYGYTTAYAQVTDANGNVTKKYFNARNKTTSIVDAAGQTTAYGYDPLGRLTSITAPDGGVTRIYFDSLNRRTRVEEPQVAATTYAWDATGNLSSISARGKSIKFTYDALNRVRLKQPEGDVFVSYTYDEPAYSNGIGRPTTIVDASGSVNFSYTSSGQIAAYSKHIDGSNFSQRFSYDRADRPIQVTYPNGSHADYSYTDGGNLSALLLDGATIATWSNYDVTGKPGLVSYGNGVATTYQYDPEGHLTTLSTKRGAAVLQDLTYDWYGRPNTGGLNIGSVTDHRSSKICSLDGSNTDETQTYSYDALYRLTKAVGSWGTLPYVYSSIGNPTTFGGRTLNFAGQQVTSGTGLTNVTYDPATGNMTNKVLDGVQSTYTWTAEGRLATVRKNGLVVAQMTYDAEGERAKKIYTPSTGPTVTTTYVGLMYEKRAFSDGSPERHTIHLFGNGQLIASVTRTGSIVTTLNDMPRWREQWALGSMYDPRSVSGAWKTAVHAARTIAAYPGATRRAGMVLFGACAVWLLAALLLGFRRRGFARRVAPRLRFASLGVVLAFGLGACNAGPGDREVTRSPVVNGDTLKGPPPGTYFYHRNHVNSSSVITDYLGNEATRYVYQPFGQISQPNSCGTDTVTAKFTGQEYDEETNLYYYRARYYDASIGRFLSPDSVLPSLTDAQSLNRYSYVRNNPIMYVDPTGHFLDFIGDAVRAVTASINSIGDAVRDAARWVSNAVHETGDYFGRAGRYAWLITKAAVKDRATYIGFAIALVISIATQNPAPLQIWAQGMVAAIAAQSLALAAGVRNPTVLMLIANVAALAAGSGSLSGFLKGAAAVGLSIGLGYAEKEAFGSDTATKLAPVNALIAIMVVNGVERANRAADPLKGALASSSDPRDAFNGSVADGGGGNGLGVRMASSTASVVERIGATALKMFEIAAVGAAAYGAISSLVGGVGAAGTGAALAMTFGIVLVGCAAVVAVAYLGYQGYNVWASPIPKSASPRRRIRRRMFRTSGDARGLRMNECIMLAGA